MKFRYGLQKIVDLKVNEKTQAEWMLSDAVQQCDLVREAFTQLNDQRVQLLELIEKKASESASISSLRLLEEHDQFLEQCIISKRSELERAEDELHKRREELQHKMLDEKIWCEAREKARESFVTEQLRLEQNQLDELSSMRFVR